MSVEKISFENPSGLMLSALLETPPDRRPQSFAIFAHCFTCNKNFRAVRQISSALAANGFGVLSFDFTGLGESDGEFSETTFSGSVTDLIAAADHLTENYSAPKLMIGHSLGGAAALLAASKVESVAAVVTIGAPAEPQHVKHHFKDRVGKIVSDGRAVVDIGGRPFELKREFVEDIDRQDLVSIVGDMQKAFLFLHSPEDRVVSIENAAALYKAAGHPKSFVSLSGADHLLSAAEDGRYAGDLIASWAARYIGVYKKPDIRTQEDVVAFLPRDEKFTTVIGVGQHRITADEPETFGGNNFGPSPYGLVSSALAACTAMTLRLYADRKGWDIGDVHVHVTHGKSHGEDCIDCEKEGGKIDVFSRKLEFTAELDEEQLQKLLAIANKCPVYRTLETSSRIETSVLK
ncbi:bifunctional alpha/beta hydrolase/OsmC family protein [soil metagenome]